MGIVPAWSSPVHGRRGRRVGTWLNEARLSSAMSSRFMARAAWRSSLRSCRSLLRAAIRGRSEVFSASSSAARRSS